MTQERLSDAKTNLHYQLTAEAADGYIYSRVINDTEMAKKWARQLIVLAITGQTSIHSWPQVAREHLLQSAAGSSALESVVTNTVFFSGNKNVLRKAASIAAASITPAGAYTPDEVVQGFAEGKIKIKLHSARGNVNTAA